MQIKSILSSVIVCGILAASCNSKPKNNVTITSKDGKETVSINANALKETAEESKNKMEELQKLTPLSNDELKAFFPEELGGMKRNSFNVQNAMGAAMGEARYKADDTTDVKVSIIDCAGNAGAGIYSLQYLTMMNIEREDDNEIGKTIDFNGSKAFESIKKNRNEATLTYFAKDRLMVTLEGENVNIDQLKQFASSLKL